MPKIDIKLASGRLPSRRGSGQLSPVLLSSSKGSLSASSGQVNARVSAPRVNERSANVGYTPLKPNDILVDKSLDAMGHTAQVFAESAFRFQQRQDRADADALVLAYQQELGRSEIGYTDPSGQAVKGFLFKEAEEATGSYQSHRQQIDGLYNELLMSAPENVRQEAALRMNRERASAQEKAAIHQAREFKKVEGILAYQKRKQAEADAVKDGPLYFADGRFEAHLLEMQPDDPEARDGEAWKVTQTAMYDTLNNALRDPNDNIRPEDALALTGQILDAAEPLLSKEAYTNLEHWWIGQRDSIDRLNKKEAGQNLKNDQQWAEKNLPLSLSEFIKSESFANALDEIEAFEQKFSNKTDFEKQDKLTEAFQGAYTEIAKDLQGMGAERKISRVASTHERVMAFMGNKLPKATRQALDDWVTGDDGIQKDIRTLQNTKDKARTAAMMAELSQFDGKGAPPYVPRPSDMDAVAGRSWDKIQEDHARRYVMGLSDEEVAKYSTSQVLWKGKQVFRPLNEQELDFAMQEVVDGNYSMKDFVALLVKNRQLKNPNRAKAVWEDSTLYKDGLTRLEDYAQRGHFFGDFGEDEEIPKEKKKYEHMEYNDQATRSKEAAAISWQQYAAKNYPDIKFTEWYKEYLSNLESTFLSVQDERNLNKALLRTAKRARRPEQDREIVPYGP